ncbi:7349_t:CDS:2 [Rhizophagus irregularis]|nr:7349_t:CDS:2 [Rhizophagus irregularis]
MSLHHFNVFSDNNNSDHEYNSEFIDNSLQQPYYENVSNTTGDYVTIQNSNIQESISTSNLQYHQASLQHDEHVQQNDFASTPHDYDNARLILLKIKSLKIVIKLQNDQTQQKTQYVRSSTLPKNRIVNRMSPYRKPNEQNFRNKSSNDAQFFMTVPQLNRSPAVHMQNVDNNRISRSQFQPDDDLNESFRSNYDN